MAVASQMHPRDLPLTEQEEEDEELVDHELPDYDEDDLPTYERSSISFPTSILQFRQTSRKLLTLESADEHQPVKYKIANKGPWAFSGKMDMILHLETGSNSMVVGGCEFDNSSTLPWFPRATVSVDTPGGGSKELKMEAKNFSDWAFTLDNARFVWTLQARPTSLALVLPGCGLVAARFSYSTYGTTASKGAEVGDLTIYGIDHGLTTEMVICSCTIALKYWAKMGRHHRKGLRVSGRYTYGGGVTLVGAYSRLSHG